MKNLVIKIGGSLLYNDDMRLNELFLSKFKQWYEKHSEGIEKLVIVIGGGKLSRQLGGNITGVVQKDNMHNVAMQVTQVNAEILKGFLNIKDVFVPQYLNEAVSELQREGRRVVISGGLKSGWSTDMDAAVFADSLGLKTVYKLSNIDAVYTKDPKKDPNAKRINQITWAEYMEMFEIKESDTHLANTSSPISVETVLFCKNKGITYFVSGGKTIYESQSLSEVFESGTKISPN